MSAIDAKLKDDVFMKDMKELNIDKEDLLSKFEITSNIDKDKKDKITALERTVEEYQMALRGRELVNGKYVQSSKAIAGEDFIRLSGDILKASAQQSNLIAKKSDKDATMQFVEAFNKINSSMLRDRTIKEEHYRMILKDIKDRMWHTFDILKNTNGNMGAVMGQMPDGYNELREPLGGFKQNGAQ